MGFFSKFLSQPQQTSCKIPDTHPVVRQISDVLRYDVSASGVFGPVLAPAINFAADYFDQQIARIPGPLDISAAHYIHAPLVHAMFPTRQDIAHGIGRSLDVKQPLAFIAGADQPEVFALLGVRRQKQDGTQDKLAFADHTLRGLAATEQGARQGVRTAALARIVVGFGEHLNRLRNSKQLPRSEWNIENRQDLMPAAADSPTVTAEAELVPENMLRGLVAWFQRPGDVFQVVAGPEAQDSDAAHQIDALPQLLIRDRRRWHVCFVRLPTAEAVAAIQNETGQHRYLMI